MLNLNSDYFLQPNNISLTLIAPISRISSVVVQKSSNAATSTICKDQKCGHTISWIRCWLALGRLPCFETRWINSSIQRKRSVNNEKMNVFQIMLYNNGFSENMLTNESLLKIKITFATINAPTVAVPAADSLMPYCSNISARLKAIM